MKPENIRFFKSAAESVGGLRRTTTRRLLRGSVLKKDSGKSGMTYDEAVLESLCFGWIDGQTNRVDDLAEITSFLPHVARAAIGAS